MDRIEELFNILKQGRNGKVDHEFLKAFFEERYYGYDWKNFQSRASYMGPDQAGYAGWILSENNPTSGPYQGTSFVWFPGEGGSVAILGIGTGGFGPDTPILARPGHRRRLQALSRLHKQSIWVKPDLLDLNSTIPTGITESWPEIDAAIKTYDKPGGAVMYAALAISGDSKDKDAKEALEDLVDLFFFEHGVRFKGAVKDRWEKRHAQILSNVFSIHSEKEVETILEDRRFIILQGPPGTGKTRMAVRVAKSIGTSSVIQFHPSKTYEDFVIGLSPDVEGKALSFGVREGDLLKANMAAKKGKHVLVIDEINRADLSRVLGEAVILFESGETGRYVDLPHKPAGGEQRFSLDENLFVVGTLNTADRSIAKMDIAIRRRFAFIDIWPDVSVVKAQGVSLAVACLDDVIGVFTEHVDEAGINLIPGHAYFLDPKADETKGREERVRMRLKLELLPLLQSYVDERLLGAATGEIRGLIDQIQRRLA